MASHVDKLATQLDVAATVMSLPESMSVTGEAADVDRTAPDTGVGTEQRRGKGNGKVVSGSTTSK